MFLLRLALKNVLRKTWRSVLTAIPVLVGVYMTLFGWGLIDGIDNAVIFGQIKSETGHFRVLAPGYLENEEAAELDLLVEEKITRELLASDGHPGPKAQLYPRLVFQAELSDGRHGLMARGIGIDPATFFADFVLPLESEIPLESTVPDAEMAGGETPGDARLTPLWIGASLANDFDVAPGDTLTVLARTRHGSYTADDYRVQGLVRSQNPAVDNFAFFLPLDAAQSLLDADGLASDIVGLLPQRSMADEFATQTRGDLETAGLEMQTWAQRAEPILRINRMRRKILGIIVAIIILVAATSIANTVVMAAFERVREIGTLRSLGLQVSGVVRLFLFESLLIGLAGSAAGCVLGVAVIRSLDKGLDLSAMTNFGGLTISMSTVLYVEARPGHVVAAFLIGLTATLAAALYPALKFSRLSPMEALRS